MSVVLVTTQVSVAGGAIVALGGVIFCVTVVDADAVQPLAGLVTVTVYVPGEETVLILPLPPPLQAYVAPAALEEAVSVTEVTAQVSVAGGAIVALGGVMFCVTVVDADAVQPLAGSVTVTL